LIAAPSDSPAANGKEVELMAKIAVSDHYHIEHRLKNELSAFYNIKQLSFYHIYNYKLNSQSWIWIKK
jgi:hypothetical protein